MLFRTLLSVLLAISMPLSASLAYVQDVAPPNAGPGYNSGSAHRDDGSFRFGGASFRFGNGARISLQALWRVSDAAKQERVACIGGYERDSITYITRVVEVVDSDADSLHAAAAASLRTCSPPEWLGTVHTHVARLDGLPYTTFSGADRGVMRAWHGMWHADGVFCVLYDDHQAYCEAGDDRSGDATYAYRRGNNLAQ